MLQWKYRTKNDKCQAQKRYIMVFYERFKEIRAHLGLTQSIFSENLGVKQRTISNWEEGRNEPNMDILAQLHTKWNINIDWLLTGKGSMVTDQPKVVSVVTHSNNNNGHIISGSGSIINNTSLLNKTLPKNNKIEEAIELLKYAPEPLPDNIINKLKILKESCMI